MTTLTMQPTPAAKPPDHNRLGLDFHKPMPRPKVNGLVIDWHVHILAARHAPLWFDVNRHYGIDCFVTMTPLEEALTLQRDWPGRLHFIAIPKWQETSADWREQWLRRIEAFYNLGSRIAKFHVAPGTMAQRGWRLDSDTFRPLLREAASRGMILMSHIGDPQTWYNTRYTDTARFGTRDDHFRMWENVLAEYPNHPWVGAHLGGNPEDFPRLQAMLDKYPQLMLDCSATRWMAREISLRRDQAREFFIRNADRILFGTDQVTADDRGWDFLAGRTWVHRKLWETAYIGPSPIFDPALGEEDQPTIRGLALPDLVLQKLYHDNAARLLAQVGLTFA